MNKEQYQVVYEDENTRSIWTYDKKKFKYGPVSVEIIDKNEVKSKSKKTPK